MYNDFDILTEDDLKTDFHVALDKIIDKEVEKRVEERIKDIDELREKQKQYDEKIADAQTKVKEADDKRREAERALYRAERERDNAKIQCEQSISDVIQQKLDDLFGNWLKEELCYYLEKEDRYLTCPCCSSGKVCITLSNGDQAITKCKVCGGKGSHQYQGYTYERIQPMYPSFLKKNNKIIPYFLDYRWNTGLFKVPLEDVMTKEEAISKAASLTKKNKEKTIEFIETRKKEEGIQ